MTLTFNAEVNDKIQDNKRPKLIFRATIIILHVQT